MRFNNIPQNTKATLISKFEEFDIVLKSIQSSGQEPNYNGGFMSYREQPEIEFTCSDEHASTLLAVMENYETGCYPGIRFNLEVLSHIFQDGIIIEINRNYTFLYEQYYIFTMKFNTFIDCEYISVECEPVQLKN